MVDIYDALITARTYKPALSHEEAIRILEEEAAKKWRDPDLVALFANISNSSWERSIAEFASSEWEELQSMRVSLENMQVSVSRQAG